MKIEIENALKSEAMRIVAEFKKQRKGLRAGEVMELAANLIDAGHERIKPLGVNRLQVVRAVGVCNGKFKEVE